MERTGHRLTLWQVPEVCNLLRHLNINKNLSWKGNYTPNMPLGGRRARGKSEKAVGSWGQATAMILAHSGRERILPCNWGCEVSDVSRAQGPTEASPGPHSAATKAAGWALQRAPQGQPEETTRKR